MKNFIKKILPHFGFEIRKYTPSSSFGCQIQKLFNAYSINTVLDVGANTGQYAEQLRINGYKGKIISFEPLSSAYRILKNKSERDPNWIIVDQAAIGDYNGVVEINISNNSVSSSILKMNLSHEVAAPESLYVGKETIDIRRLDDILDDLNCELKKNVFLKIDTQGYEEKVLNGAQRTLNRISGLQIELSTVYLYDGQLLFDELIEKLQESGFKLSAVLPGFIDPSSGKLLQFDGIFFLEDKPFQQ